MTTFTSIISGSAPHNAASSWDFSSHPQLKPVWAPYEFVDFVAIHVDLYAPAAAAGCAAIALTTDEVSADDPAELLAHPVATLSYAATGQPLHLVLDSAAPGFGRRLKGTNLGNEPPCLAVCTGSFPTAALPGAIRIALTWRGHGTSTAFTYVPPADAAAATESE